MKLKTFIPLTSTPVICSIKLQSAHHFIRWLLLQSLILIPDHQNQAAHLIVPSLCRSDPTTIWSSPSYPQFVGNIFLPAIMSNDATQAVDGSSNWRHCGIVEGRKQTLEQDECVGSFVISRELLIFLELNRWLQKGKATIDFPQTYRWQIYFVSKRRLPNAYAIAVCSMALISFNLVPYFLDFFYKQC